MNKFLGGELSMVWNGIESLGFMLLHKQNLPVPLAAISLVIFIE